MARTIQAIFVDPPIAIARLGGSNAPQDAYRWVESANPRSDSNTVIDPWWTLDVLGDGSVEPRMPTSLRLRDGDLIRPVAPFFEVWALVGKDGDPASKWSEVPLTPALLKQFGVDETALSLQVDARNLKAARRRRDNSVMFGTFPPVAVRADDHRVHTLFATSPPGAKPPMIPPDRNIPLGSIQIIRSRTQPKGSGTVWEDEVDVEIMRFRFTPGRGRFYGPPEAAKAARRHGVAVEKVNAFLNDRGGWFGEATEPTLNPADTYDLLNSNDSTGPSLGIVDDTCEARVEVTLAMPGRKVQAHANVFVGPPDFAPDRRPFLSLADELSDRGGDAAQRDAAMGKDELDAWVQDLFERVYETASLLNLDQNQRERSINLAGRRLRSKPIPGDGVTEPRNHAMTSKDALRNDAYVVSPIGPDQPLPLTEHARTRHRTLQDIDGLRAMIAEFPGRFEALVRQPFEVEEGETADANGTGSSTMRMPPFMRNSNGFPLTLAAWQYALLSRWLKSLPRGRKVAAKPRKVPMSDAAAERRAAVLARIDARKPRS